MAQVPLYAVLYKRPCKRPCDVKPVIVCARSGAPRPGAAAAAAAAAAGRACMPRGTRRRRTPSARASRARPTWRARWSSARRPALTPARVQPRRAARSGAGTAFT